jgi:hypothetical protein
MWSITFISSLFILSWTIIGSIIFWSLIDKEECSKGVYNYVFALLIIRYILLLVTFCCKNNRKEQ